MTTMIDPEITAQFARERCREALATAEHDRLVLACERPLPLTRRAARPLGRVLYSLGAWLLRYGKAEQVATMRGYRPSVRSIEMN
jgi:hypothetical protein